MKHFLDIAIKVLLWVLASGATTLTAVMLYQGVPWARLWDRFYHSKRAALHYTLLKTLEHRWDEPSNKYDGAVRKCLDCGAKQVWDGETLKWHS